MVTSSLRRCLGPALLAAVALTACGGTAPPASSPVAAGSATKSSAGPTAKPSTRKAVRKVKLEVIGKGEAAQPIMFTADESGTVQAPVLPWSRTAKIELTGAEQEVGRLVSIVAGSVRAANGQFRPAPCRITVDGEVVASGKGMCKHMLK